MHNSEHNEGEEAAVRGVVVLSDVQKSREISDRSEFAARLDEVLESINGNTNRLLGAFDRQAGVDEFAAVVRPGCIGAILTRLWMDLHPVSVRYAVVLGDLDVVPRSTDGIPHASDFDGPAFHRANERLEGLRSDRRLVEIDLGEDGRTNRLLTALSEMVYGAILDWTDRQLEIIRTYQEQGSQVAAADVLGVEQSTISRSLSAASYPRINRIIAMLREELDAVSAGGGSFTSVASS